MGHSSVRSYGLEAGIGLFAMQKVRTKVVKASLGPKVYEFQQELLQGHHGQP